MLDESRWNIHLYPAAQDALQEVSGFDRLLKRHREKNAQSKGTEKSLLRYLRGGGVASTAFVTTEARASQWARIEEVAALPPALRERLYTVLLDAVPHLAAEKQLFRAVSTVLGAVIEYNESTRKRS